MASSTRNAPLPGHEDGDVEIYLSRKPEDRFVLHSVVLGLHSSYFKASLSSCWARSNHGSAEGGTIKWKYQLRFDEEAGDLTDPLDLLARATAEADHATETPDINVDTAALFTKSAPWVPLDNDKTSSRTNFENAIKSIHTLVQIADAYDSLTVVSTPVEKFLILNYTLDLDRFSNAVNAELFDIAIKIRSRWLLKEIGCRILADPRWDDHEIEHNLYSSGAGELLLSKRAELRDMLRDIDQRIVLLQPPTTKSFGRKLDEEHTIAFATAAFRHEVSRLFHSYRKGDWISYARKFRLLKERLLWNTDLNGKYFHHSSYDHRMNSLYEKFGRPANLHKGEFEAVFHSLQKRTAEIIKPLFRCVVKQPSAKLNKRDASFQGFLCIDLTDADVPWEDNHFIPTGERDGEA